MTTMITQSECRLSEHEVENAERPWVLLRARGYQMGIGTIPGRMLYNVVAGGDEWWLRSTVTVESMIKAGYRVEVIA